MILKDTEETRMLAAEIVKNGGLIAFRTDTFYGLGADPLNPAAVERIKRLKGREEGKPILLLISEPGDADRLLSSRTELFELVAGKLWPGPLTLVVPASSELPEEITARTSTVGIRLPDDDSVRSLVKQCGGRLTATSANISGAPPAKSAAEVASQFPEGIELIIDGGEVTVTEPSTVLDVTYHRAKLIREGAVSKEKIEGVVLGEID